LGGGLVVVGWAWLGRRSFCGLKTSNIKVIELLRLLWKSKKASKEWDDYLRREDQTNHFHM